MVDITATLFRFRQFVFEYGPFFLAAWLGVAVATGLIAVSSKKGTSLKAPGSRFRRYPPWRWLWQLISLWLGRPGGKTPTPPAFSGALLFTLAASVPALVVTSLIGSEAVWLRLGLAALLTLSLNWFVTAVISGKPVNFRQQPPGAAMAPPSAVLNGDTAPSQPGGLRSLTQITWKSFIGQVEGAVIPVIIGFILASVLTIYLPPYTTVRPWLGDGTWLGPYLAALLAMPLQLTGGAEVPLASALLVKGASLGTALSVMLVAPSTTFSLLRHLGKPVKVKMTALYLAATWFVAGSLGVAVDAIQRLVSG